jgi:hypothetical protein
MQFGTIDSVRTSFVEEAVTEFRRVSKEERSVFDKTKKKSVDDTEIAAQQPKQTPARRRYILATILLAIKGDHTSGPFKYGVDSKRDFGRALSRIATDAQVEGCLIGSEMLWKPHELKFDRGDGAYSLLSESDVLKAFPDLTFLS